MEDKDIFDALKEIIEDSLEGGSFNKESLNMDTLIFEEVVKNSISAMYVALMIEDRFGISFDNDSLKKISTVKDLIDYIKSKQV